MCCPQKRPTAARKFCPARGGNSTFHAIRLGDVSVAWENLKELHTDGNFAVSTKLVKMRAKRHVPQIPTGKLDVVGPWGVPGAITSPVHPASGPSPSAVIATKTRITSWTGLRSTCRSIIIRAWLRVEWGCNRLSARWLRGPPKPYTFSGPIRTGRVVPRVLASTPRKPHHRGFHRGPTANK